MKRFLILFLCFYYDALTAQVDTLGNTSEQEDLIESFLQEQETDADFDYNDLFEELNYLLKQPLDLNRATPYDLDLFPFLSPIQKTAFLRYVGEMGPLISTYELQAIPYFDMTTIRRLLPFVKIGSQTIDPLSKRWKSEGNHQLLLRWSTTLEQKKGFLQNDTGNKAYQGDPNNLYLRYRFILSNRLSFGFTAEKDEGETFFQKDNKQGFDFYSAHFLLQNPTGTLSSLALGDYSVSMGQGLIPFNGFAPRKGPATIQIKRTGAPLRRYSSVNESDFFRGAAASFRLSKKLQLTTLLSSKRQDANIEVAEETSEDEPLAIFATSLQNSGKHRTLSEIADKHAVRQSAVGGILKWEDRRLHLALNTLNQWIDQPLERNPALYNQFSFSGKRILNSSLDYSYTWRNLHFFGETALSNIESVATTNGLLAALDQRMDLALLYRHFPKNYQSLNAKPFAETGGANNEQGLYVGLEIRPYKEWVVNAYFDLWKHPWLRFRTDAPSQGQEWLLRISYKKRRKFESHIQVKNEIKPENVDTEDGRFDRILQRQNFQGRIHLSYQLTKNLEWRSRLYAGFTEINGERIAGTALFQDLKYRALGSRISFSTRFAVFDTEDYAIRFYAYENDVLNSFSVPAYYDRGSRFYLLMGYRIRSGMLLEGRLARTNYTNRETIGSGNDEINGPEKTDVKLQLRWSF